MQEKGLTSEAEIREAVRSSHSFGTWMVDQFDRLLAKMGNTQAEERTVIRKARRLYTDALREIKNTATNGGVRNDYNRSSAFEYETLVNKPDMKITVIDDSGTYANTPATRKNVIDKAIENAKKVGWENENGNAVVHVDDINKDIILSKAGIRHGLDRRLSVFAPVAEYSGEILKKAIKINELTPVRDTISQSYVLIGAAKNNENIPYFLQFVVNRATNEVSSVDVLYSENAKKESAALLPEITGKSATLTDSDISIANLLDYVNKFYPDILPESVLKHYGYDERPNGKLGESALFSYSTIDSDGNALSKGQQEYFKDSKVRDEQGNLIKVYHGTDANFTVFDSTKSRANMDIQGMFFSPWEIDAGGYGETKAYYLDIKNPAPEDVGYRALNRFKGQNNAGAKAREYLISLGYDGVNNGGEEYIAFYPNQIKLADNSNPTQNEDIRYSYSSFYDNAESNTEAKDSQTALDDYLHNNVECQIKSGYNIHIIQKKRGLLKWQ